jgi:acetyltransferase-like isoleucine patch superfamily enzyme
MSLLGCILPRWQRMIWVPLSTIFARATLLAWGVVPGPGFRVHGRLRLHVEGLLRIGSYVRVNSGAGNFVGGEQQLSLWVSRGGSLSINDECALSNSTIIAAERVDILEGTFIGGGCLITDSDHHALDPQLRRRGAPSAVRPVRVGPRAFVGARSVILKGVQIGQESVIAAGSVVVGTVPPREIWGGVPARKIGDVPVSQLARA